MFTLFNNIDIILNISKYLIEPSILIIDHYYKDNKIKFIIDKKHQETQLNAYLLVIKNNMIYHTQFHNIESLDFFIAIINNINEMNQWWRSCGHSIYFSELYIKKNFLYTMMAKSNPSIQNYNHYKNQFLSDLNISYFINLRDINIIKKKAEKKYLYLKNNIK